MAGAIERRATDPAQTAELQKHFGMDRNQVPLAMLQRRGPVEHRTAGGTPAPADVGAVQRAIIRGGFPAKSAAAFLGIMQETVPTGEQVFTVLSTSAAPGTPAENADQAVSAAAFSAHVLVPARIQASLFFSREDRARFAGMEEALSDEPVATRLADKLDDQILTGAGSKGLFTGTNLAHHKRIRR